VSDGSGIKKEDGLEQKFQDIQRRISWTFYSILIINWILVGMGAAMFMVALYSAVGLLRLDITALLSATGFGNILAVFKFSMNRVQRSLGDQVQVEIASYGYIEQIKKVDEHLESNAEISNIKAINEEIRKATFDSMELIQNFTEIGKPLKKKPWISRFPIRYVLCFPDEVYIGKEITATGTLRNVGDEPIELTSIVIAIRPPFGTPSGGPFRFDFLIAEPHTLSPGESFTVTETKRIEDSAIKRGKREEIPEKYLGEDWVAFLTCQTDDGNWHDAPNKRWFKVIKEKAATEKK
jgi:hypothetical protein